MKRFRKRRDVLAYYCPYPCCDDNLQIGRTEAHEHVTGRKPETLGYNTIGMDVARALSMG